MSPYELTYEVWSERDGVQQRWGAHTGTPLPAEQIDAAAQWNEHERNNARREGRGVRIRFFVARVLVSYEEMGA